jgi:aspartyl-tRNA synthetase
VLRDGGAVKALVVPGASSYSRRQISELEVVAKNIGAQGLAWMKVGPEGLEGGISRFFKSVEAQIKQALKTKEEDLILFVAADWKTACLSLGAVRNKLASDLGLIAREDYRFCWIIDFPLFEWSEGQWQPAHHMFTMPQEEYLDVLEEEPGSVKGDLYDLVLNGVELASGSIRIHDPDLQKKIFKIVGLTEEEAERRFGFLTEAFKFGAPPHGGIAPGLDRLVMLMAGKSTIREVIPFPKNTLGISPMDECPSDVEGQQLEELGLTLKPNRQE